MKTRAAVCVALLTVASSAATPAGRHDKAFWRSIVSAKFAVPDGERADALSDELAALLGDPDPEVRDDCAYSILARWIAVTPVVSDAQANRLVDRFLENMSMHVGETGNDTVLLRSFSALTLSTAMARENKTPFMGESRYRAVLAAALRYFEAERDVRGFDQSRGWIHSVAHTADLIKFTVRNPYLRQADQTEVLTAIAHKVEAVHSPFVFGEDERIGRALLSLSLRADCDQTAFKQWLSVVAPLASFPAHPDTESLARQQNAVHLLTSLHTLLSLAPDGTPAAALRKDVLDAYSHVQ